MTLAWTGSSISTSSSRSRVMWLGWMREMVMPRGNGIVSGSLRMTMVPGVALSRLTVLVIRWRLRLPIRPRGPLTVASSCFLNWLAMISSLGRLTISTGMKTVVSILSSPTTKYQRRSAKIRERSFSPQLFGQLRRFGMGKRRIICLTSFSIAVGLDFPWGQRLSQVVF